MTRDSIAATAALAGIQIKSVLAATDLSPASEKSVRHGLAIARYCGATPYVLHVTPSYRDVSVPALDYGRHLERELEPYDGQFLIREGDVWPEIQKIVRQRHIDMAVIGTHGRNGLKKLVLGSVAEQVFRHLSCPVVTVGPNAPAEFDSGAQEKPRPVLFATDFCDGCAKALTYAMSFANRRETTLALLHVLAPTPAVDGNRWYTAADVDRARHASRARILEQLARLVRDGALRVHAMCMAEFGQPADRIDWAAERLQAEVIMMGLKSPRLDSATLSWRTAYEVVCKAPCPVMTIRSMD